MPTQVSRSRSTLWLTLAAVGLWALSLGIETRWPWLSLERGGPRPQALTSPWVQAVLLWLLYWAALSGYWGLRFFWRHQRPRLAVVFATVALLQGLLYFLLQRAPYLPLGMSRMLSWLTAHRAFGLHRVVVGLTLPSFVAGSLTALLFAEITVRLVTHFERGTAS